MKAIQVDDFERLLKLSTRAVDNFVCNHARNGRKRLLRLAVEKIARFRSNLPISMKSST
ncbi:MAG TPA: hypothetical protein VIM34_18530 [Burkholderiaceae bacterium]